MTRPLGNTAAAEGQDRAALTARLEQTPLPHRGEPGMPLQHTDYLPEHTSESIGSLSHLIRAAVTRSSKGPETITRPMLSAITIDHHDEEQHRATRRRGAPHRPAAPSPHAKRTE